MLHQDLSKEKWHKLSFFMQMANIGAEVGRAVNWRAKDLQRSQAAFERGLELLDLTLSDKKNHTGGHVKELLLLRGILIDYFAENNECGSSEKLWNSYFNPFNYAASLEMKM